MCNTCSHVFSSGFGGIGFRQLCAEGERGVGTCGGDSRSPLTARVLLALKMNLIKEIQYDIMVGGVRECSFDKQLGIFTSIVHYMDWILDQLKP